jgi:hypothetical protein
MASAPGPTLLFALARPVGVIMREHARSSQLVAEGAVATCGHDGRWSKSSGKGSGAGA